MNTVRLEVNPRSERLATVTWSGATLRRFRPADNRIVATYARGGINSRVIVFNGTELTPELVASLPLLHRLLLYFGHAVATPFGIFVDDYPTIF